MVHDAPFDPISDKTVVVTGATGGIGSEFCKQLLEKKNRVIAACRKPTDALRSLGEEHSGQLTITELDVSDGRSIAKWASELSSKVDHVHVCINNAGTTGLDGFARWALEDATEEDMMHAYMINAVGPTLIVQQLLKHSLLGGSSPSLVANVTSKVGSVADNGSGAGYAYRASKSALNNITKSMSIDLAPQGITCTLLHPGYVRTKMTEGRGLIDAPESAGGLIRVMEGAAGPIAGRWYDYKLEEIPW